MAPALPAATVMLVRDLPGFEVLMVRRHHQIEFASGALVFPGGKVEAGDRDPEWAGLVTGADGLAAEERAFRICAIREAFEESGILLAGEIEPEIGRRVATGRDPVARGEVAFGPFVAEHALRLDLGAMVPFARWITPAGMSKRFDTCFYLMTAPPDQVAACDGYETVDAEWLAPREALRLREAGQRTIVFPTRLNLALLAESGSVPEALATAAACPVRPVEPVLVEGPDGTVVSIAPDLGYGVVPAQRL